MVEMLLVQDMDETLYPILMEQREMIEGLINQNVITNFVFSLESGKGWMTMLSKDVSEVDELMSSFPMIEYLDYDVHLVAVHMLSKYPIPSMSLN